MILFMKRCLLYNYADNNSLFRSSKCLDDVNSRLERDGNISKKWFAENGMQTNPDKFQFMLMSLLKIGP